MKNGFAVKDDTGILVHTVAETERAAKVNWLHTDGHVPMFWNTRDELIEEAFTAFQKTKNIKVVEVDITERVHEAV